MLYSFKRERYLSFPPMDNLLSSCSVNSETERDFMLSFLAKPLCCRPHEGQRKTAVGKETHSTEVFWHSRHLLFPGRDNKLFTRKKDGRNYIEGHHLIPLKYQDEFEYSLDVEANIVSLCPSCHRLLHYGNDYEEKICELFEIRKERLKKCNIYISKERLIEMYQ